MHCVCHLFSALLVICYVIFIAQKILSPASKAKDLFISKTMRFSIKKKCFRCSVGVLREFFGESWSLKSAPAWLFCFVVKMAHHFNPNCTSSMIEFRKILPLFQILCFYFRKDTRFLTGFGDDKIIKFGMSLWLRQCWSKFLCKIVSIFVQVFWQ